MMERSGGEKFMGSDAPSLLWIFVRPSDGGIISPRKEYVHAERAEKDMMPLRNQYRNGRQDSKKLAQGVIKAITKRNVEAGKQEASVIRPGPGGNYSVMGSLRIIS